MKTILVALLGLGLGFSAHATIADKEYVVMKCQPVKLTPDIGMQVIVIAGGFAGLTEVQVRRQFLGHKSVMTYVVQQELMAQNSLGAPVIYDGKNIRLMVNFTKAPDALGGHYGTLQTQDEPGNLHTEELSCKLNNLD